MTRSFALAALVLVVPFAAAADTLVVAGESGAYKPGLATSWSAEGDTVTFALADGVDGGQLVSLLSERLAQAQVSLAGGKLLVRGIPLPALLDQLSTLSLSGDADPLAALASLGGGVPTGEGQEAGGSIRASNPAPLAVASLSEPPAAELVEAEVLGVVRSGFPQVVLELKVRRSVAAGVLEGKRGRIVRAPVLLAGTPTSIDFSNARTQRNLAAYYLKKGDRVVLHAAADGGQLVVDWIERN